MDNARLQALETQWASLPASSRIPRPPGVLALKSLTLIPSVFQCRPEANAKTGVTEGGRLHLAGLTRVLKDSPDDELDPVTVLSIGSKNILVDGHHRVAAYRAAQRSTIPVIYFNDPEGPRAAVLGVGQVNRKTKLSMSTAERTQWAWELVKAGGFTKAEVSAGAGVSDRTVGTMRMVLRGLNDEGAEVPAFWLDARPGREGFDHESAAKQAQEWARRFSEVLGPAKTFTSTGKKAMLADALMLWSPRIAEELVALLAEDMDMTAKVQELHAQKLDELAGEALDTLVYTKARELIERGEYTAPGPDGGALDF
ncbi:hypothetical protein [Pelomonas sp. KK5]|uniref:ParB/RepB/Spo0J family partition protein n=1 Tax=Pelomonas sp. KK5 TaxID=1855730 RepID=UPI00097C3155|nr:hypothetical protein [Pelomonas sp. KK5]